MYMFSIKWYSMINSLVLIADCNFFFIISDNSKPKPVIKDCGANYDGSHHQISLSWDKNNINIRVKHYQITFNCSDFYKKVSY